MLRKRSLKLLKESLIEMNSFIKEFSDEEIEKMNKKELKTCLYEWLAYEHNYEVMKNFIIKDIANYLYLLEDEEIKFTWKEQIIDTEYNLPVPQFKAIIHNESFIIKDFKLQQKKEVENRLDNKIEEVYQVINPCGFNEEKLDKFYTKLMIMVKKDSIFSKMAKIKDLL